MYKCLVVNRIMHRLSRCVFFLSAILNAGAEFDYADLEKNWNCRREGNLLGNFPEDFYYHTRNQGFKLSAPPDTWTTFPTEYAKLHVDDRGQQISWAWGNISEPISFKVKPNAFGPENRILVQLSLDQKDPTSPPYKHAGSSIKRFFKGTGWYDIEKYVGFDGMWELMEHGIFNCHINRHINLRTRRTSHQTLTIPQQSQLRERFREQWRRDGCNDSTADEMCPWARGSFSAYSSLQDQVECGVMVTNPLCCYSTFRSRRELENIRRNMGKELYDWNEQKSCLTEYEGHSEEFKPGPSCEYPEDKQTLPYIADAWAFAEDPACNSNLFTTAESCQVKEPSLPEKNISYVYPCSTTCYSSIVLQIEIIPLEDAPAEVHVSAVVERYTKLLQPPRNVTAIPGFFGYHVNLTDRRTDYLGVKVDVEKLQMSADEWTPLWIGWEGRDPEENKGPVLLLGLEGRADELLSVDLSRTNFAMNGKEDPLGFKFGWRGVELQRPLIENVFRPYFVTLNTIKNAEPLSYAAPGHCKEKEHISDTKTNQLSYPFIIAGGILLALTIIGAGVVHVCHRCGSCESQ